MFRDTINAGVGDLNAAVVLQVPDDPDWHKVTFAPQMKFFVKDLNRRLVGRFFRNKLGIRQASFTMLLVCVTPPIKTGPADTKYW